MRMERTITVRGTGKVSLKPDLIVIQMELVSRDPNYEKTMTLAATTVAQLQKAIVKAGFKREDLKTSDLTIDTENEHYRDENHEYKTRFVGYVCKQNMKLEFELDTKRLSHLIVQIGDSAVEPKLSIRFTVKDRDVVEDQLLMSAAESAKKRAALLVKGAGAELGELLTIDYSWNELRLHSPTLIQYEEKVSLFAEESMPEIEPDDINVSDSATFVWSLT